MSGRVSVAQIGLYQRSNEHRKPPEKDMRGALLRFDAIAGRYYTRDILETNAIYLICHKRKS